MKNRTPPILRTALATIAVRESLAPEGIQVSVGPAEPPSRPGALWPRVEFVVPHADAVELGKLLIEFGTGRR